MNVNNLNHVDPDVNYANFFNNDEAFRCKYYSTDSLKSSHVLSSLHSLSIISFNIRSFSKNSDEFLGFLLNCEHEFDIIVLTETWARDETQCVCFIPGYKSVHNYRNNKKGGGVSIFVKDNLSFVEIDELNISNEHTECIAINVFLPNSNTHKTILGLYRQPRGNKNIFIESLDELITRHNLTRSDTIITGDFNICLLKEELCDMTKKFTDMLKSFHFYPLITRPTRIDYNNTLSVIDHIWVNSSVSLNHGIIIADVTDHFPIFCTLSAPEYTINNLVKIRFRDMSDTNYITFKNCLDSIDWGILLNSIDINEQTETFLGIIENHFDNCFPIKTKFVSPKRLSNPWLTQAILNSINMKHRLYKRVKQHTYDRNAYAVFRRTLTTVIRLAKQNYLKNKFDRCKHDTKQTWDIINNIIRPGNKNALIQKLILDDTSLSKPSEIANAFNLHFSNIGKKLKSALTVPSTLSYEQYLPPRNPHSLFLSPTTSMEVTQTIKKLKNKKQNLHSPSVKVFKLNAENLAHPIASIFNNILNSSQYPNVLKTACVTPLFKSGDKNLLNNYRPISSLPVLNLVVEKLLHSRLCNFLDTFKLLSPCQFGFRKGFSTSDAVNEFLSNIYDSMKQNRYLAAVFLDLSKAFDTVSHDILLNKMDNYGIRGTANLLLKSYLSNRKQFVSVNGAKSDTQDISIGVPQGSVLGPLLFLIYINDLPLTLTDLGAILFADDTTLYFSHSDKDILCQTVSSELNIINNWLLANFLTLNTDKTYYIIFSLKSSAINTRITIGSKVLDRQTYGKFLGVFLDEKLTFKNHLNHLITKLSKIMGIFYKVKYSFPPEKLLQLYYSLVYPHLSYCILAWGKTNHSLLKSLSTIQKKYMRLITLSPPRSHTNPIFSSLKVLKLDDIYLLHSLVHMYKTMVLNKYPLFKNSITMAQPHHNYSTRLVNLIVPHFRVNKCKQMLIYQCIRSWNYLPLYIKDMPNATMFKKACINFLLSRYTD